MKLSRAGYLASSRLLVGYLGENAPNPWWGSQVLTATGLSYLEICFPRNTILAGMNAVSSAARIQHDQRIGVGRVYHLFRLRPEIEEEVHRYQLRHPKAWTPPQDFNDALDRLKSMGQSKIKSAEGPLHLGDVRKTFNEESLLRMIGLYAVAFESGKLCFPYFTEDA